MLFRSLVSEDGKIFKQAFAENEHLVGLKAGDKLRIEYESSGDDADDIAYMTSYEYIEK